MLITSRRRASRRRAACAADNARRAELLLRLSIAQRARFERLVLIDSPNSPDVTA